MLTLGQPPKSFDWRYKDKDDKLSAMKTYTPLEFYKETIETDVHDYVMLMDDPSKAYYKNYEIELDRNTVEGVNWTFVNLPVSEIKQYAKTSILADEPMYFSCDVGKQLDSKDGYLATGIYDYESLFGVKFNMDKRQRILTFPERLHPRHGVNGRGYDRRRPNQQMAAGKQLGRGKGVIRAT